MKLLCGTGPIQISQAWRAWSRHQLTALAGSVLTGSNQAPECVHLGTRSSKQEQNKLFGIGTNHTPISAAQPTNTFSSQRWKVNTQFSRYRVYFQKGFTYPFC